MVEPSPLLRLPEELIDKIFRLANEADSVPRFEEREPIDLFATEPRRRPARKGAYLPICRRLYPIQQTNLYRTVCITTHSALALFCATVRASPVVRDLVVEVDLRMEASSNVRPEADAEEAVEAPADDPEVLPHEEVGQLA